jgi:hypothetical protein
MINVGGYIMLTTCSCGKEMAAIKDYLVVEKLIETSGDYKRTTTYTQETNAGVVRVGLCKDCLKSKAENWIKDTEQTKCRPVSTKARIIMAVAVNVMFAGFAVFCLIMYIGDKTGETGSILFGIISSILMALFFNLIMHIADKKHIEKYNRIKKDMQAIASGNFDVRRVSQGLLRLLHEHEGFLTDFGMLLMDANGRININPNAKPERRLRLKLNYKGYNGTPPMSGFYTLAIPEFASKNPLYAVYKNNGLEPPYDLQVYKYENEVDGFFSESYKKAILDLAEKAAIMEMNKK